MDALAELLLRPYLQHIATRSWRQYVGLARSHPS